MTYKAVIPTLLLTVAALAFTPSSSAGTLELNCENGVAPIVCNFGCSNGDTLNLGFTGFGEAHGGCGGASVSCDTSSVSSCNDDDEVTESSTDGTCTATGIGFFSCTSN